MFHNKILLINVDVERSKNGNKLQLVRTFYGAVKLSLSVFRGLLYSTDFLNIYLFILVR